MAKTTDISQSEHVRRYISKHPQDGPKAIVAGLHKQGIEVSYALASHVRHMTKNAKARPAQKKRAGRNANAVAARNGAAEASKADQIRATITAMGRKFQTRDVIDTLKARGVAVTASHVRAVAVRMGLKRRRRGRPATAGTTTNRPAGKSQMWSLNDLIAAKKMAEQLGGIEAASQALAALAKLS